MVLGVGFEPTRAMTPTRPSTLRVYQFHHPSRELKRDGEDTYAGVEAQAGKYKKSIRVAAS